MNSILPILFLVLQLAIFLLAIWYVGARFKFHFQIKKLWLLILSTGLVLIGSLTLIIFSIRTSSTVIGVLSNLGGHILISFVFLLLALLLFQFIGLFWKMHSIVGGLFSIILSLGITVAGALNANHFVVNETEIPLDKLKSPLDVMLISDVHVGHHRGREYLSQIVNETNKRSPKLILITGDLVDSEVGLVDEALLSLSEFEAPVFYVGGNHEKDINELKAMETIASYGVQVLHNEIVDTLGLQLIGLDYMKPDENTFDMHPSSNTATFASVLPHLQLDSSKVKILMHHSPVGASYVSAAGVDLFVAGHTHAGQVFPWTLFAKMVFPFNEGIYQQDKLVIYVTKGAGTFFAKSRLASENEIRLLHLRPAR